MLVSGAAMGIYWQLRFLATIYKFSVGWFLGVLVIPLADWVVALLYFKLVRKPFCLSLIGSIIAFIGFFLIGSFR